MFSCHCCQECFPIWISRQITWGQVFMMSKIHCQFCSEIAPEGRGGEKGGGANFWPPVHTSAQFPIVSNPNAVFERIGLVKEIRSFGRIAIHHLGCGSDVSPLVRRQTSGDNSRWFRRCNEGPSAVRRPGLLLLLLSS